MSTDQERARAAAAHAAAATGHTATGASSGRTSTDGSALGDDTISTNLHLRAAAAAVAVAMAAAAAAVAVATGRTATGAADRTNTGTIEHDDDSSVDYDARLDKIFIDMHDVLIANFRALLTQYIQNSNERTIRMDTITTDSPATTIFTGTITTPGTITTDTPAPVTISTKSPPLALQFMLHLLNQLAINIMHHRSTAKFPIHCLAEWIRASDLTKQNPVDRGPTRTALFY